MSPQSLRWLDNDISINVQRLNCIWTILRLLTQHIHVQIMEPCKISDALLLWNVLTGILGILKFFSWLIIVPRMLIDIKNFNDFITFQVGRLYWIAHFSDILRNMGIDLQDENLFYTAWRNSCSDTWPNRICAVYLLRNLDSFIWIENSTQH